VTRLWHYLAGTATRPRRTFACLLAGSGGLALAGQAVLLAGALYTLTVIALAVASVPLSTPPWLAIPAQDYYTWEAFFTIPIFLLGWILAAGLAQLLVKPFRGRGTFEATLTVLGFALAVPMSVTWLVETALVALVLAGAMQAGDWQALTARPGFWQLFALGYQLVALAWYLLLVPMALAVAHTLRWWQATLAGILTLLVVGSVMAVFIR
jgi:hypothetical protein